MQEKRSENYMRGRQQTTNDKKKKMENKMKSIFPFFAMKSEAEKKLLNGKRVEIKVNTRSMNKG